MIYIQNIMNQNPIVYVIRRWKVLLVYITIPLYYAIESSLLVIDLITIGINKIWITAMIVIIQKGIKWLSSKINDNDKA